MTVIRLLICTLLALSLFTLECAAAASTSQPELTAEERQWLKDHPVIRLAPDPDFKPIEYFDAEGRYRGAAADMISLLEKKLGIVFTIVQVKNWDEAMARFQAHEVDVLGAMVRTPNRERFALFTETLVSVPGGIFTNNRELNALGLHSLKGMKVAVVSNYAAHDVIRDRYPEIELHVVPDVSTGLAKAALGMVDVYVENMANATFYAQEAGIANLHLAGKTDFDYRWGIGIRKDWPVLQSILNKGIANISAQEREQAISRYIAVEERPWLPSKALVAGTVAAVLGGILLLSVYWNIALKKVVRDRTMSLQAELEERLKAQEGLLDLTEQLEHRVAERTHELEKEVARRAASEQAAISSGKLFRELFNNVADPVYISDSKGRLLAVNDQACHEVGYTRDELLGMTVADLDVPPDPGGIEGIFGDHPRGTTHVFETQHRRKDGSVIEVEVKVRRIEFEGVPAIMGTARNISERKQAEAERASMEQQMLHAQKLESLGVLAGGIAHDFNNILTAIVGNAELALMRLGPDSPVNENLKRIEAAAARASDLAKQMLAYSGKGKFVIEATDLNALVKEMGHMLDVSVSKKAQLCYRLAPSLPTVDADATQLRQIVMNLVINASEAIGDNEGVISVSTGFIDCDEAFLKEVWLADPLPPGRYVFLEVTDSGCGMNRETLAKIFDPFFTTKFTGRGLGMAAVLGIMRGHRGAIRVSSVENEGSSFRILLPEGRLRAAVRESGARDLPWRGGGVALLVDDEETVLDVGSAMLNELGFEVVTAPDGHRALEVYRERSDISVVILDLTMPRMDGEQCFRELRQINPEVKVIISSGYSEHEVTQKFAGTGVSGFVQKPYRLTDLRSAVSITAAGA